MKRLGIALLLGASVPALAQSVVDRARTAAAASSAKTGDSDALLHNVVTPGMSGQPISTVNGAVGFTPSINCQKTANLLELLVQPGSTGDIDTVRVSQDTDFDGSFDTSSTLAVPISGICANGVISCQPGSWNQCNAFKWDAGSDHALKLTQVNLAALAGCYCVNSSCGSNLVWGNLSEVLKDLGGGMIGALTSVDPRFGVAQARINGPVIDYVGAQTTSCAQNQAISQTSYAANPAAITGDASNMAAASSVFQMLKGSSAGVGKAEESRACTIERQLTLETPSIDAIIRRTAGGYAEQSTQTNSVDFFMGSPGQNNLYGGRCGLFDFRMTLHVLDPDRILNAFIPEYFADDWVQLRVDGNLVESGPSPWTTLGLPPGACEQDRTTNYVSNLDLKPLLTKGDHEIWLRVGVGNEGEAFARIHVDIDGCATRESIVDQCAGYARDAQCHLQSELTDGVEVVRNGVTTGLRPIPQTRTFGTGQCSISVTRDFFERDRVYRCKVDTGQVTQPDLNRGAYIIDHSTETLLTDQTKNADGSVSHTMSPFSLPDRGSVPSCEAVCKTRAPKMNTAAGQSGIVGAQQNDPSSWDTFYHVCSASNLCPTGAGEQIVTDCGCLDDFPEAVVMMQSVRLAGTDMVCTSAAR